MLLSNALKTSASSFITLFSITAFFFLPPNCMIIYILLVFSIYSFAALHFSRAPESFIVLTSGLEQLLIFFIPLIINNLYTKLCLYFQHLATNFAVISLHKIPQANSRTICSHTNSRSSMDSFSINTSVYLMYTNINLHYKGWCYSFPFFRLCSLFF